MNDPKLTVSLIRRHCVECSGDSAKGANWCSAFDCLLWPFRLGQKPATIRARYGDRLLDPAKMPDGSIELELLPQGIREASTAAISVPGYSQPEVVIEPGQRMDAEERAALVERLKQAREAKQNEQ